MDAKDKAPESSWGFAPSRFAIALLIGLLALVLGALLFLPRKNSAPVRSGAIASVESNLNNDFDEGLFTEIWDNPLAVAAVEIPAEGLLSPDDVSFMAYFDQLYADKQQYYGREIEVAGLVLRDDDLAAGEFLVGRNLVWCCDNDSYFVGFLAFGLPVLPADGSSWRIRGWLEPRPYTDPESGRRFDVPAIRVSLANPDTDFMVDISP